MKMNTLYITLSMAESVKQQDAQRAFGCRGLWMEYPLKTNFLTRSDNLLLTILIECLSCFTFFEQTQHTIALDSS